MTGTDSKFAKVLQAEFVVWQGKGCLPLAANPAMARKGLAADKARLAKLVDALSLDELREFGEYRKANKWW